MDILPITKKVRTDILGIAYNVLSVGFSQDGVPIVSVSQNERTVRYVLPLYYYDWVEVCYEIEKYGIKIFPKRVLFGMIGSEYYVMMDN